MGHEKLPSSKDKNTNLAPAESFIDALTHFIGRYTELIAVGYIADIKDPSSSDPEWCEGDKKINLLKTSIFFILMRAEIFSISTV